jgi:hypothetical protein
LEQKAIIDDINHHIGETHIVHVYGLKDLDTQVTLRQNVTIHFQKLLLGLCAPQTNHWLLVQVEKETTESVIFAFNAVDHEMVMHHLPRISSYIRQCVMESDYSAIFANKELFYHDRCESHPYKKGAVPSFFETDSSRNTGTHIFGLKQSDQKTREMFLLAICIWYYVQHYCLHSL